jgi:DNA topoisomerase-6 subunit B
MYGQLTTGKSIRITSTTARNRAHYYEIQIDTRRNAPEILVDQSVEWEVDHGTRVELDLAGVYKKGRHSVDDYIDQTAIANPHAEIYYLAPDNQPRQYPAAVHELPTEPKEIKPHPYGVELGILIKMLKDTKARTLSQALRQDFSRVSDIVAQKICEEAELRPSANPHSIATREAEKLYRAINRVKIMNPPTNCLSPIGEEQILKGLQKQIQADFYAACSRPPSVYRGNPFQIEAGLAYGGKLATDELIDLMRFANRVPLSYQQSACAITKAVMGVDWRSYGLSQNRGALPAGPAVMFVHIASVWVPFTSESKEAIAGYPEIIKEIRLALQEIGRKLQSHVRRHRREVEEAKKRGYIEKFIPHIGIALREILSLSEKQEQALVVTLKDVLEHSRS